MMTENRNQQEPQTSVCTDTKMEIPDKESTGLDKSTMQTIRAINPVTLPANAKRIITAAPPNPGPSNIFNVTIIATMQSKKLTMK